jgi:hypothetical protein
VEIAGDFNLDGHRVVLIDTPGFDDITQRDTDIFKLVADFLETPYVKLRLGLQRIGIVPFLQVALPSADTKKVPLSPVSSTSTGYPMSGWMGYR